jgi:hypothetical protein
MNIFLTSLGNIDEHMKVP